MVDGLHGENGGSAPERVEEDGVEERETLPTLNLITLVRGKSTRIIFIMTWNVAKHKTVHVGIPEKILVILDNLDWYCDVTNVFICQRQIQILT